MRFHLRYSLSRSQRIGPLLAMDGIAHSLFHILLFAFFCLAVVLNAHQGRFCDSAGFAAMALGVFLLARRHFVGLLDVLLCKWHEVDLLVEENAAGILIRGQRWWFFFDSITSVQKYRSDLWTIRQFTGLVLHIPTTLIRDDEVRHITSAMQRGHTPEGIQRIISRGKMIERLLGHN